MLVVIYAHDGEVGTAASMLAHVASRVMSYDREDQSQLLRLQAMINGNAGTTPAIPRKPSQSGASDQKR